MDHRDFRQIKQMQDQISLFKEGRISLQSLIGELIFLRDALFLNGSQMAYS